MGRLKRSLTGFFVPIFTSLADRHDQRLQPFLVICPEMRNEWKGLFFDPGRDANKIGGKQANDGVGRKNA